jgi:hypothetical protein
MLGSANAPARGSTSIAPPSSWYAGKRALHRRRAGLFHPLATPGES